MIGSRNVARILTLALSLAFGIAQADELQFGGTPGAGMAGAGLALPTYVTRNNILNPALLGFARHDFVLDWPSLGVHTDGVSLNQLRNQLGSFNNGGLSTTQLQNLAITDGDSSKQFGVALGLGLTADGFALNGISEINITTVPNAALSTWSKNGASTSDPTINGGQLDAYGLAYAEESVGYGDLFKKGTDRVAVGATFKVIQAYYAHKIISNFTENGSNVSSDVADGTDITQGGGSNDLQKSGAGLDVGAVYNSTKFSSLYGGIVVENAIEPNIKFDRQLPDSATVVTNDIDIFKRAVDVGLGWIATKKTHVALDVIDVGNKASRQELRTGVDYSILLGLSARAGYSSYSGFEVGASFRGFAFSYGSKTRLSVGTSYKF